MRWSKAGKLQVLALVAAVAMALALISVVRSAPAGAREARPHHAIALLHQQSASRVSGDARFSWRARHHILVARMRLKHLAKRSRHAAQLEAGTCASGGRDLVAPLHDVAANEFGGGHATTRIRNLASVDFRGAWHVAVYDEVEGQAQLGQPVACGDLRATT